MVNTAFMQYSHTVANVQEEVKIRDNFTSTVNMINTGHTFAPRRMGLRSEQMRYNIMFARLWSYLHTNQTSCLQEIYKQANMVNT